MRVSYSWLKTLVDVTVPAAVLADRLALTGTEVDAVDTVGDGLDGIVVGHILTRERHPDADTLWVTTVDVGTGEPLQIVCGAQNFVASDKVPVACVGTTMPDGRVIKKSKLRGVVSYGMNCSESELGISADARGLLILPEDAPVGMPIARYLGVADAVLDCDVTPNRPDCLSMHGMAREVGAVYDLDVTPERFELIEEGEPVANLVDVTIADAELCPRYTARVIRGVKVGPSPEWLARRVVAAGARPVNNVVDVTNYVLFSLGQPLHAFDLGRFPKMADGRAHVVVRAARDGEPFTTLDGTSRELTSDMAVIAAATSGGDDAAALAASSIPMALAGVMGGLDSEVTDATVDVLLESATFSPAHTSRTSRNLSLVSEASIRYERGVDDNACADFSNQAAALMAQVTGGTVCAGIVDTYLTCTEPNRLTLRVARLQALLGALIPEADVTRILTRLGCTVEPGEKPGELEVRTPTFRPDLPREIDLYEEVLRLWGMDRVRPTLPGGRERIGGRTVEQIRADRVGAILRACGLNETVTYSFAPHDDLERLGMPEEGRGTAVELINPMSAEQRVMRRSIVPGLLRSVASNQAHGVRDIHLYEEGRVFAGVEGRELPREHKLVAAALAGAWVEPGWNQPSVPLDFFDAKGVLENLFRELAIPKVRFKALDPERGPWLQPGRAAEVLAGGRQLGWVGEVHPLALEAFHVKGPVVAFELSEEGLFASARVSRDHVDVPHFPAVSVDLALVVDECVTAESVEQAIASAGGKLLESIHLFDVYRDEDRLGLGKKSLAFSLTFRAEDRTLTSDEVDKAYGRLVRKVRGVVGGEVRG